MTTTIGPTRTRTKRANELTPGDVFIDRKTTWTVERIAGVTPKFISLKVSAPGETEIRSRCLMSDAEIEIEGEDPDNSRHSDSAAHQIRATADGANCSCGRTFAGKAKDGITDGRTVTLARTNATRHARSANAKAVVR